VEHFGSHSLQVIGEHLKLDMRYTARENSNRKVLLLQNWLLNFEP